MRFSAAHPLALAAIFSLATACPSDDPESGETGAGSSGTSADTGPDSGSSEPAPEPSTGDVAEDTTGGEPPSEHPACGCVGVDEDGLFIELSCDFDEVCDPLVMGCDEAQPADCAWEDLQVTNPEALACHQDALADQTVGLLRWELPFVSDPGVAGQRMWIVILGDGQGVVWAESWGAGTYDWSDTSAIELRDAAYFEACTEGGASSEEAFRCLFDPGEARLEVCVDEHSIPFG